MSNKPPIVIDRRRVDDHGRRRNSDRPRSKRPEVEFRDMHEPLKDAFRIIRAQLEHLPEAQQWPRTRELPAIARGFVISMRQCDLALVSLIADARAEQFVFPAGAIVRVMLEGTANLMAILEDPEPAIRAFARDDYRSQRRRMAYQEKRFDHSYAREERKLRAYAADLGLSEGEIADPNSITPWPSPGEFLTRTKPPRLGDDRKVVFQELYRFWYPAFSEMSHHLMTAIQLAIFSEEQPNEETFALAKSQTATLGVLTSLCVLAEIETFFHLATCVPLRVAWERVRTMDKLCTAVYEGRYRRLLNTETVGA
jgi:hypothetical protein